MSLHEQVIDNIAACGLWHMASVKIDHEGA